ncbi:MAG: hypothetical protein L0227_06890, partial [Chloroflexi bacterium]|nr:hypothetical protein [Chloroflexota bacterium]
GLAGIGGVLTSLGRSLPSVISRSAPSFALGAGVGSALDFFGGGGGALGEPFATAMGGRRAKTFVVSHPDTGRPVWFRPAGRPLLWSSDFSSARRVRKLAARAARTSGRRRRGGR